jgi:hypothetical protein
MNTKKLLGTAAIVATTAALLSMAVAQNVGDKQGKLAPQFDAEGMKRWQATRKPDFHHEKLAEWIGSWNTEMRVQSGGPDSPPNIMKGTCEISWLMENRWLKIEQQPTTMGIPGTGFGLLGFDKHKSKYVGSWVDSQTTTLLTFEGNFDHTDKQLFLYGLMDEPASNEHDKHVKYVWRLVDKDKMTFEVHDLAIGDSNTKVIEINYTRKK